MALLATACTITPIDDVAINANGSKNQLQVVGRVTQYTDCDVATRSKKDGDEPKVTSMGLALFPIDNGVVGNCLYYDFKEGGSIVFIVDRHNDVFDTSDDKKFVMYIFANMQDAEGFPTTAEAGVGKSLAYFTNCAAAASADVENVPANGFPMMGSLGAVNTNAIDGDTRELILKPTAGSNNVDGLPMVDGTPTDNLEIPLKAMYAKFSFTISVKPDQEIVGNKAPRFDLLNYKVNNIADTVDANSKTNEDNEVIATSGEVSMGSYAQGATTATFDFYLPERYLNPSKSIDEVLPAELKKGTYDTVVDANQNGYRDQDEKYHQRYKNKLVDGKAATYVTINGKYTDHQGHVYDVAYNIYLGGNNYDNFDIIRNTHYDNSVTIRGISTSDDQSVNEDGIAIDWRVNVTRSTPLVINMRREALLDAHFEVRPLRLRLVGETIPTGTNATVQILNENKTTDNIPDWIRLEMSGNTTNHITSGVSAGKRKYFTTDLVTNTLKNNTTITVNNLTTANQTVWIYVDENTDTKSRTAIVSVTYNNGEPEYFKIVQNGLYSVVGADSGNTYYIEQYEEFLYNYDAEDDYGQTKDEGMPWGLDGVQLSNEHRSFTNNTNNNSWSNYLKNNVLPTYDFYIAKHDGTFAVVAGAVMVHRYAGQHFTSEIVENSNGGVKKLTMDQQPSGAVEYCYNRNKRNSDGSIAKVEWYLPSADELEDFIVPAYSTFEEFQNNYYWTSQPAYIRNVYYYEDSSNTFPFIVYDDNPDYARATKVVAKGNNVYEYALSGMNEKTNIIDPSTGKILDFTGSGEINFGYFNLMYRWKSGTPDTTTGQDGFGGVVNGKQYKGEEFNEKLGGSTTGARYHVHLGHLYDMTQEGYHHRTQYNRVRCARKEWSSDNEQTNLVYKVSDTLATTLDTSGNTLYVMRNTAYTSTSLTTSGTNLAANSSAVNKDNLVVIKNKNIKSITKDKYFNGTNGNVSFSDSATNYSISNGSNGNFTISYGSYRTYYLKQTDNTSVSMSSGTSGNHTWYFYEVTIQ